MERRTVSDKFGCRGYQFYSTSIEETEYGTKIAYLPCSKYNLSQIDEREVTRTLRDRCCVLHLKGNRKGWIKNLNKSLKSCWFSLNLLRLKI